MEGQQRDRAAAEDTAPPPAAAAPPPAAAAAGPCPALSADPMSAVYPLHAAAYYADLAALRAAVAAGAYTCSQQRST
jgi:hypothetical protein